MMAIRDDQQRIRVEEGRDLRLVSLELVKGLADSGLFIRDVLEFHQGQRNAVGENHHVRAPIVLPFLHRALIDGQEFVLLGMRKIHQPDLVMHDAAVVAGEIHVHAIHQQPVKRAVALNE